MIKKSKRRVVRPARERDRVPDVVQACHKLNQPLESHTKARMRHFAVPTQIEVRGIGRARVCPLSHRLQLFDQNLQAFLPLGAADEFAHARDQDIHRSHGLAVVVGLLLNEAGGKRKVSSFLRFFRGEKKPEKLKQQQKKKKVKEKLSSLPACRTP